MITVCLSSMTNSYQTCHKMTVLEWMIKIVVSIRQTSIRPSSREYAILA
jgi:hypothetical protein